MEAVIKKEILNILTKSIDILEIKEATDIEKLKELSDQSTEHVALYKNLDLISITVLVYSLYKVINLFSSAQYNSVVKELKYAQQNLEQNNLGRYNSCIKSIYEQIRKSDNKVKEHLQDIMHAARIKKSASLLQKGLSIGQAAGLMGLSNWDLQDYAGKNTPTLEQETRSFPAKKRIITALKLFGVS